MSVVACETHQTALGGASLERPDPVMPEGAFRSSRRDPTVRCACKVPAS